MVAGGGASVIYADTICALGGSEELGRGKQKPQMYRYHCCRFGFHGLVPLLPEQGDYHKSRHIYPCWLSLDSVT